MKNACHRAPGRTNRAAVVEHAAADCRPVDRVGVRRCDTDDRMVRRYAVCLTDTSTTLHRLTTSGASGTVMLSAEAKKERLRGQLEKGEFTMGGGQADRGRYRVFTVGHGE